MNVQELITVAELSSDQATLVREFAEQKIRIALIALSDDGEIWSWSEIVRVEASETEESIEHAYRRDLKIPAAKKIDVVITEV